MTNLAPIHSSNRKGSRIIHRALPISRVYNQKLSLLSQATSCGAGRTCVDRLLSQHLTLGLAGCSRPLDSGQLLLAIVVKNPTQLYMRNGWGTEKVSRTKFESLGGVRYYRSKRGLWSYLSITCITQATVSCSTSLATSPESLPLSTNRATVHFITIHAVSPCYLPMCCKDRRHGRAGRAIEKRT